MKLGKCYSKFEYVQLVDRAHFESEYYQEGQSKSQINLASSLKPE